MTGGSPRALLAATLTLEPLWSTGNMFIYRSNFHSVLRFWPCSLLLRQSGLFSISITSRIFLSVVLVMVSMVLEMFKVSVVSCLVVGLGLG